MCVSVAMVTRFKKQQNNTLSRIGPRNLCTKYELHRPSNSIVMNVCICCHGNKVYKATNYYTISYWPKEPMYQIGEVENSEFSETSENQFSEVFNSEFSILHYTQNGKLGDENLGVLFQAFLPNSEFSILHYTQNGKLRVGNLGVFSKVYQNSDFF